jgi:hypothetical protein
MKLKWPTPIDVRYGLEADSLPLSFVFDTHRYSDGDVVSTGSIREQ